MFTMNNPWTRLFMHNQVIFIGLATLLALGGAIALWFLFYGKKKQPVEGNAFFQWVYDFLTFKKQFFLLVLKISYCFTVIFLVVYGLFAILFLQVLQGILIIAIGNIIARVIFEYAALFFRMNETLTEINNKKQGTTNQE